LSQCRSGDGVGAASADPAFQAKLDELADKNTAGGLSAEEQALFDLYLAALSVLTVLQSQARILLEAAGSEARAER